MILVNGEPQDSISANDRGLAYGDGVFRTLAVRDGKAQCWQRHFAKLCDDCRRLDIPSPAEPSLRAEVAQVARDLALGVVKIIVTRGQGERGYAKPSQQHPTRIVMGTTMPPYPAGNFNEGIKVRLCELRLADQPRLAGIKHLNRLENVLARAEWNDSAISEGLLLDQRDNFIEGVTSNLFIVMRGVLVTPDLGRCGVAGVTRERILTWARDSAMPSEIRDIPLAELLTAEEVMICNSLIGVWQVREIATQQPDGSCVPVVRPLGVATSGKCWARGTLTPTIRQYLTECHV